MAFQRSPLLWILKGNKLKKSPNLHHRRGLTIYTLGQPKNLPESF